MTFMHLNWVGVVTGAFLLALLLYALHRLTIRRRVVKVAAAMLWAQAVRQIPARVLGNRFRYLLPYLLALIIALGLWVGWAGPELAPAQDGRQHIFYLEESAYMQSTGHLQAAQNALIAAVRAVPPADRQVYIGDGYNSQVLDRGEDVAILIKRLNQMKPNDQSSNFTPWIRRTSTEAPASSNTTVHYFGYWGGAKDAARQLPANWKLSYGYLATPVANNAGIVNLGVSPTASGDWRKADILIETAGPRASAPTLNDLAFTLGGAPYSTAQVRVLGPGVFLIPDVDAMGESFKVELRKKDSFPGDDAASIRIPDRRPVKVAILSGVPATIAKVVRLDPAFQIVPLNQAQVVVKRKGDNQAIGLPAFLISKPGDQSAAFVFAAPQGNNVANLTNNLQRLGLTHDSVAVIASQMRRPIGADMIEGSSRSLSVWAPVLDGKQGFSQSRAFPVFVSESLRWLSGADEWISYAHAGDSSPDQSGLYGLSAAGDGSKNMSHIVSPSLLSRSVTLAAADKMPTVTISKSNSLFDAGYLFVALILLVVSFLALEWIAFRRGLIP